MRTTRFYILSFFILSCFGFISCSSDDNTANNNEFVVAFKHSSENFLDDSTELTIELVYSSEAPEIGNIDITYTTENLTYGESNDFVTNPLAAEGIISIPVIQGTSGTSFELTKLTEALPNEEKSITFSISNIDIANTEAYTQGNTTTQVFYNPTASLGGTLSPEIGGPNEPNQVYLSLSRKEETLVKRDTWDLGFYSGNDFRVKLNSSIYMFVAALDQTDIDNVRETDVNHLKSGMDFLVEGSDIYVDNPNGDINGTAIQAISENEEENPVYLLKLGHKIGTETPSAGGVAVAGEERGYKKIRILRHGEDYILQYADLNSTSHQEITISKNSGFNFNFFSFDTENIVSVEPEKTNWDLNFTVKTETQELPEGGQTAYGFSDYVETNTLGNVKAYRVSTDDFDYDSYSIADVDENEFVLNQRVIGSSWREVTPPDREVFSNIFYVLKDANENYYKIKFISFLNENGVRGYPEFKYELLN